MTGPFAQAGHGVRLEWGVRAVEHVGPGVDAVVVVDVMSFSSCVEIACARGGYVYPYRWRDDSAIAYGEKLGAAVASRERGAGGFSLSPTSLTEVPAGLKLVLPSRSEIKSSRSGIESS